MVKNKKTVCYIGASETTCSFISQQLKHYLDPYIEVRIWCLSHDEFLPDPNCDIYIAASHTVLETVKSQIPSHKRVLVAARTLNIGNFDRLLGLAPGTRAVVVAVSEETAMSTRKILEGFGFSYLDLSLYYPGCGTEIPNDISIAITPGVPNLVPRHIEKTIDLGTRGLDISTFAELIQHLGLSLDVINIISHDYIEAILRLGLNLYNTASLNETLKRNMEVILNTVDEAIVAVDIANEIVVFNPAAEKHLEINSLQVTGRNVTDIIPQVDFLACLKTGEGILQEIKKVNDNYFIVSANPIREDSGLITGVVATFRPVGQVEEMEVKVRRELKNKGNIAKHIFSEIVGESQELQAALSLARKFSRTELTILLEGESGTGKELFAQAIHNQSQRRNGPFVAINFAALPENLVESELFGYVDGAFTGAKKGGKPGLFEEAHTGTIFLDEIGDSPLDVQKRLLRVLEEREVRRLGDSVLTPIDVRVIAATNQDLEDLVRQGRFRADLFYRLCTLPINIPPLRQRTKDILPLIHYFTKKLYKKDLILEAPLKEYLLSYQWPGNIRELQNIVKYLCSVAGPHEPVTIKHLPPYLIRCSAKIEPGSQNFRPFQEGKPEMVIRELKKQDSLEPVLMVLREVSKSAIFPKGIGRQAIIKSLPGLQDKYPEHKVRQWLKLLNELGYIESGKTRQGSKITKEGQDFLTLLEKRQA